MRVCLATLTKLMILPEHALAGTIRPKELATGTVVVDKPIGTGPFKFKQYVSDQYVELVADRRLSRRRAEGRPGDQPLLQEHGRSRGGAASRRDPVHLRRARRRCRPSRTTQRSRSSKARSYVVNYLGFNQQVPLWKDVRVRQAVMHAIDRKAIIDSLYGGAAKPGQLRLCRRTARPAGSETLTSTTRPRPRRLLTEAGWDKINGEQADHAGSPITARPKLPTSWPRDAGDARAGRHQRGAAVVDTPTYNGIIYARQPDFDAVPARLCRAPERAGSVGSQHRPQRSSKSRPRGELPAHRNAD